MITLPERMMDGRETFLELLSHTLLKERQFTGVIF